MPPLATAIRNAADKFADSILAAVKGASLQELLALQAGAPAARRGRPPKAKAGRKPGRPPKAVAKKAAAKAAKKIKWPKCKHEGCKRNAWAQGKGFCGQHAKAKA